MQHLPPSTAIRRPILRSRASKWDKIGVKWRGFNGLPCPILAKNETAVSTKVEKWKSGKVKMVVGGLCENLSGLGVEPIFNAEFAKVNAKAAEGKGAT